MSILSRIDDQLLAEVREKGAYLRSRFEGASGVESVSGLGLMVGVKTVKPAGEVVAACRERGLLLLTAKDKVRLLPPLTISMDELAEAADIILDVTK